MAFDLIKKKNVLQLLLNFSLQTKLIFLFIDNRHGFLNLKDLEKCCWFLVFQFCSFHDILIKIFFFQFRGSSINSAVSYFDSVEF